MGSMEDTLPCPTSLACNIPHQAIKCSLAGVRPVPGDWPVAAGDKLFDLTRDGLSRQTDTPVVLVCQASQVTSSGYSVRLTRTDTNSDLELASELVTAGLAGWEVTGQGDNRETMECVQRDRRNVVETVQEDGREMIDSDWDTWNDLPRKMFNMERTLTACAEEQYVQEDTSKPLPVKEGDTNTSHPVLSAPGPTFSPLDPVLTVPVDMPGMALIRSMSQHIIVTPRLVWSQDKDLLDLTLHVKTMRDIVPSQVHVMVTETSMMVQVLEHCMGTTHLHALPGSEMELWREVVPSMTEVVSKDKVVIIKMRKREEKIWPRLGKVQFDWVRRELVDKEDNSTDVGESKSEAAEEVLHPFTGEQVLPEELFNDVIEGEEDNLPDKDEVEEEEL